jgi:hypothetical protein
MDIVELYLKILLNWNYAFGFCWLQPHKRIISIWLSQFLKHTYNLQITTLLLIHWSLCLWNCNALCTGITMAEVAVLCSLFGSLRLLQGLAWIIWEPLTSRLWNLLLIWHRPCVQQVVPFPHHLAPQHYTTSLEYSRSLNP